MPSKTALYEEHVAAGGKMVDFAGWMMAVNYGSQISEHVAVRTSAGMFDVSHMTIIDVSGIGAKGFLQRIVANDVERLEPNQALYGALLNANGGVIDDLIVYRLDPGYRCVVNASTRDKVLDHFASHCPADATFEEIDQSMLAVQGPAAIGIVAEVLDTDLSGLRPFYAQTVEHSLVARTGYTGEDGVEIMCAHDEAVRLYRLLRAASVAPAGLGARDTLRLEAALKRR